MLVVLFGSVIASCGEWPSIGCLVFPLFLLYGIVLYIVDVMQASWRMASIWSNMLELEDAKVCDHCSFCNGPRSCAYRRDTSQS